MPRLEYVHASQRGVQWCESQKACGRLKLADLLVKPLQRLTKYKLLLYAVRSPLDKMLTINSDVVVGERIAAIDTAVRIDAVVEFCTRMLSRSPFRPSSSCKFLPRCSGLSVRPSVRLSNAWVVTKRKH